MSLNKSRWKKFRESRLIANMSSRRFGLRQYEWLAYGDPAKCNVVRDHRYAEQQWTRTHQEMR